MNKTLPLAFHWAAHAANFQKPFLKRESCLLAWSELRHVFGDSIVAAVLMPDHLHVLTWARQEHESTRARFKRMVGRLDGKWNPASDPREIPDLPHLSRQIRYVHLNPNRRHLCADPLEWEFSTHRDYLGASCTPLPETQAVLRKMGRTREAFHTYISSDPTVHANGTWAPVIPHIPVLTDLRAFERAVVVSTRMPADVLRIKGVVRRRALRILHEGLQIPAARIAAHFDIDRSSLRGEDDPTRDPWLNPLVLTLSDPRFLSVRGGTPAAGEFPSTSAGELTRDPPLPRVPATSTRVLPV